MAAGVCSDVNSHLGWEGAMHTGMIGFTAGESQLELTLSSHELLYVFLPWPWFRLGHVHMIEEIVAH